MNRPKNPRVVEYQKWHLEDGQVLYTRRYNRKCGKKDAESVYNFITEQTYKKNKKKGFDTFESSNPNDFPVIVRKRNEHVLASAE